MNNTKANNTSEMIRNKPIDYNTSETLINKPIDYNTSEMLINKPIDCLGFKLCSWIPQFQGRILHMHMLHPFFMWCFGIGNVLCGKSYTPCHGL